MGLGRVSAACWSTRSQGVFRSPKPPLCLGCGSGRRVLSWEQSRTPVFSRPSLLRLSHATLPGHLGPRWPSGTPPPWHSHSQAGAPCPNQPGPEPLQPARSLAARPARPTPRARAHASLPTTLRLMAGPQTMKTNTTFVTGGVPDEDSYGSRSRAGEGLPARARWRPRLVNARELAPADKCAGSGVTHSAPPGGQS